ncbi:MAG: DUF2637 domain-containing protein [Bifidobacteriaceae bacterium]|jgi:hypothetical protein|nr:DUF2637 domain-containing protein [Bifidobacteriaceae bacterium]
MSKGRASRWLLGTGIAGTVFIAAFAFWLSFTALTHLAVRAGIAKSQAWAWPLIVDGIIVVATVAVVALRDRKGHRYSWLLLAAGALVSVTANAVQAAMPADIALSPALAAAVSAVPPVVLLAITHLTVVLARHEDQPQPADTAPPRQSAPMPPPLGSRVGGPAAETPTAPSRPVASAGTEPADRVLRPAVTAPATDSAERVRLEQSSAPEPAREPVLFPVVEAPPPAALTEDDLRRLLLGVDAEPDLGVPAGVGEARRTSQVEEAIRLKGQGLTNRAIGQRLGVNPTTVGRWLSKHNQGDTRE